MKQLVQNIKTGKTTIEEVPIPSPRCGQALVRVAASLVSAGTERMVVEFAEKSLLGKARSRPDLVRQVVDKMKREGVLTAVQAAFQRLNQPMPLGYSSAGVIVALGEKMEGFRVGQRVACAGGGYAVHAEYNVVPRNLLTPLPDSVDFESAAFTTLGAIAMHGFRLGQAQLGEDVAVIGMGLLGLLTAQIALAAGCRVLGVDVNPHRVALASSLGISACSRDQAEDAAQAFTASRGCDVVLICADTPSGDPVELAGRIARDRARVIAIGAVGLTLPRKLYYEKELIFLNSRSYGPGRYDPSYEEQGHDYPIGYVRWTEGRNLQAVVTLLTDGRLRVHPLITHRFPIDQAPQAYELLAGKTGEEFLGIVLTYPGAQESAAELREKIPTRESENSVPASSLQPASRLSLGVIGAGLFAQSTLLPAIADIKGLERAGIASAGGLHAQHAARKFRFAFACSEAEQILRDPRVNTVAILTRHDSHAELVVRALQAGKHVFVEKPLALNEQQLQQVEETLRNHPNLLLVVGFNRRFAPLAQRLAEFLTPRHEPLFAHYRVNAGYLPRSHWLHDSRQGGGRLIGEACHFIDFLTFLVGAPPARVCAHALPDDGKYHQDNFSIALTFAEGSLGVVDYLANGDRSFSKERLEVFCEGRVAVLDDFRALTMIRDGRRQRVRCRQDKGWRAEWVAFLHALTTDLKPPIPYDHLFGVTRATFAALASLRQQGMPVDVSRIGH